MELNWTTVVLEVVNFLILVWILKRFLYRPVSDVIRQRQARIAATLDEARQGKQQADQLRSQYENRLTEWQHERDAAREVLQQELQQQRTQAIEALEVQLADLREKARVVEQQRERELSQQKEREGLAIGARFAARLLQALAGPELESRIVDMVQRDLSRLPAEQRGLLHHAADNHAGAVQIASAHPLPAAQRQALEQALQALLGDTARFSYLEDPALISGIRMSLGDWVLGANLHDELSAFADQAGVVE